MLVYTLFGGMWSVAVTDFVQTDHPGVGLTLVAVLVGDLAGGADKVVRAGRRRQAGHVPGRAGRCRTWCFMAGGVLRMMLRLDPAAGRVPARDVSAKDEKTAVRGTVIGGVVLHSASPSCRCSSPTRRWSSIPTLAGAVRCRGRAQIQRMLPDPGARARCRSWAQIMFFGALLSAILSHRERRRCWRRRSPSSRTSAPVRAAHERPRSCC